MKNNKNVKAILLGVILMVLAVAGATYAFFTATISDGDKGSSVIIRTGTLRIAYTDTEYINVSGVLPGDSYSKVITVTNEGNVPAYYHLVWIELLNELVTQSDLTMEISCSSNTDACGGLSNTVVSDSGSNIPILYNVEIGMLETHTYTITLHFNETGSNQNDNQGKIISGKIGIIEARDLAVNLYGYVYDENSSVLPNVVVELHSDPVSVVTDANGRYEFDGIPLGTHTAYIKTSDGTSTITTTSLSLKQGTSTNISDTNVTLTASRQSIGINIEIDPIDPILSLTLPTGTLRSRYDGDWDSVYYGYATLITSITFEDKINIPGDAVSTWDASQIRNGTVMAYIKSDGVSGYDLHIQSKDGMYAPSFSSNLFFYFTKLTKIDGIENLNTSKVTDMSLMFSNCSSLINLDLSSFDTSKVTNMSRMFDSMTALITLDLRSFDTSNITSMYQMFAFSSHLATINLSSFNTTKVTDMSEVFAGCSSLTSLNLSAFDTSNVTNFSHIFNSCYKLTTLNLSNWDTSSVTDMSNMFYYCTSLTSLNLTIFNTSNVTNMRSMFYYCTSLTSLNLSTFDTSKVTNMSNMFGECGSLPSLDITNFDTSSVTDMSEMFYNCNLLTSLNLSTLDISSVTNVSAMFNNCRSLTNLNLHIASFGSATSYNNMFFAAKDNITIIVKDTYAQTFINARLVDDDITGTVTIG